MGVTIYCKKTGTEIDLGGGGFLRLRNKVTELAGEPFASHYAKLSTPEYMWSGGEMRKMLFEAFNARTERLIASKKADVKIVDFLLQSDCGGSIHYGACKNILKAIGDYDDDRIYGYAGRPDAAHFRDFKRILEECVEHKCDMCWD